LKTESPRKNRDAQPEVLWHFAISRSPYLSFHSEIRQEDTENLHGFLFATIDEVRLHLADRYANCVLELTDLGDASHFRRGVLRREASGDVEYQKQRDHAAHTLHNYLLGWYIYANCNVLRDELRRAISVRMPPPKSSPSAHLDERFGDLWPYASLLHDVGYLFEGGLDALRVESRSDRVQRGAEIAEEYFRNRFWVETPLAAATERDRVKTWTGIEEPKFVPYTITAVGDALRALGNLKTLWECVRHELRASNLETKKIVALDFSGQGDAFTVWRRHYRVYSPCMEGRVVQMQSAYYAMSGTACRRRECGYWTTALPVDSYCCSMVPTISKSTMGL
jgi:hypothetical protein